MSHPADPTPLADGATTTMPPPHPPPLPTPPASAGAVRTDHGVSPVSDGPRGRRTDEAINLEECPPKPRSHGLSATCANPSLTSVSLAHPSPSLSAPSLPSPSYSLPSPSKTSAPTNAQIAQTTHTTQTSPLSPRHLTNPKPARRKLRKRAFTSPKALSLALLPRRRASRDSTASASEECGARLARYPTSATATSIPTSPMSLISPMSSMSPTEALTQSQSQPQPQPQSGPDSKWLEIIESSGLMTTPDLPLGLASRAPVVTDSTSSVLPDFSNLSLRRPSSQKSAETATSPSSLRLPSMSRPRKSASKASLIAPPAKIGQLDGTAPRKQEIRVIKRKASIELIAEQYQAFLEARDEEEEEDDDDDMTDYGEEHHGEYEPVLLEPTKYQSPTQYQFRASSVETPDFAHDSRSHWGEDHHDDSREVTLESPPPLEMSNLSPASDGTLVAFEEDAIYFKPVSFSSPEPSPPPHRKSFDKALPRPPSDPGVQPLQACIALLVKQLTTSMPRPSTESNSTQTLQISVMIEAYEKLRDQVSASGLGESEERNVRSMFDCWLAALHTMHRSYSRSISSSSAANERQVEALSEDVD